MSIERYVTSIKVSLSILFLVAILDMPFGYYQFLRITAFITFCFLSYQSYRENDLWWLRFWVIEAILFNPMFKIYFTKEVWVYLDVISVILLIVSLNSSKR
jgi:hypothetical protein